MLSASVDPGSVESRLHNWGVWAYICVQQTAFVELPDSILGLMGIVFGGKVVQRMSEKPSNPGGE